MELVEYIKTVYKDEASILDTNLSLRGISVTYNSTTDEYVYELLDSAIGYARTHYSYSKFNTYFTDKSMTDEVAQKRYFEEMV